jgi:hypothetical protein
MDMDEDTGCDEDAEDGTLPGTVSPCTGQVGGRATLRWLPLGAASECAGRGGWQGAFACRRV